MENWRNFPVRSSMQAICFQVILKAVFGLENGSRYQELTRLLTQRLVGSIKSLGTLNAQ